MKQSKKSGLDEVYQPSLIWYKEIDSFLGPVIASRDAQAPTVSRNIQLIEYNWLNGTVCRVCVCV